MKKSILVHTELEVDLCEDDIFSVRDWKRREAIDVLCEVLTERTIPFGVVLFIEHREDILDWIESLQNFGNVVSK